MAPVTFRLPCAPGKTQQRGGGITPAQLALDPCNGSVVITDVDTGDVLALVSYPAYRFSKSSLVTSTHPMAMA